MPPCSIPPPVTALTARAREGPNILDRKDLGVEVAGHQGAARSAGVPFRPYRNGRERNDVEASP